MSELLEDLDFLSLKRLKEIAKQFNMDSSQSKQDLVGDIRSHYFDLKKFMSYTYIRQLGSEGKDGRTFLAQDENKNQYAIKVFKASKGSSSIEREVGLQRRAAEQGISPRIIEYDAKGKFIVMEKLDDTLYDFFCKQQGQLTTKQQRAVIELCRKLDHCGIFHADPNPLNFMCKNRKWYVIDFGMAYDMTPRYIRRFGDKPNMKYMILGLVLKLREIYPQSKLEILENYI